MPYHVTSELADRRLGYFLGAVARLKPDATVAQAKAEVSAIATRASERYPSSNQHIGATARSLRDELTGSLRGGLISRRLRGDGAAHCLFESHPKDRAGSLVVVEPRARQEARSGRCGSPRSRSHAARFADWALVRVPRLSVMPVTDNQWAAVEAMARD